MEVFNGASRHSRFSPAASPCSASRCAPTHASFASSMRSRCNRAAACRERAHGAIPRDAHLHELLRPTGASSSSRSSPTTGCSRRCRAANVKHCAPIPVFRGRVSGMPGIVGAPHAGRRCARRHDLGRPRPVHDRARAPRQALHDRRSQRARTNPRVIYRLSDTLSDLGPQFCRSRRRPRRPPRSTGLQGAGERAASQSAARRGGGPDGPDPGRRCRRLRILRPIIRPTPRAR